MSTKTSNLLNSTSLTALATVDAFRAAARAENVVPDNMPPAPAAPEQAPEPIVDEIPISLYLMSKMFESIVNLRYAKRVGDIGIHAFVRDDGHVGIGFYPAELNDNAADVPLDDGVFDVYSDPDYHEAMQSFMTDLSEFAEGTDVNLDYNACGFTSETKLGMYTMLSEYVSSAEYAMGTPDSTFLSHEQFDPDIEQQQRAERMARHHRIMRDVYKGLPRARRMGDQPDPLFVANNTPTWSMQEFHQVSYVSANATLPCSLTHIFQTICQEDKLRPADYPNMSFGERPTFGGYN